MRHNQTATFAGGCFWHIQDAFKKIPGVLSATAGYTGGTLPNPRYEDTHDGTSGHAEAVEVVFDPEQLSYSKLLDEFWKMHDPTQVNRQGPDVGHQYRSAIFYHTPEQKGEAEASRSRLDLGKPVATEIVPATPFWRAEEYHQDYFQKHGVNVCSI